MVSDDVLTLSLTRFLYLVGMKYLLLVVTVATLGCQQRPDYTVRLTLDSAPVIPKPSRIRADSNYLLFGPVIRPVFPEAADSIMVNQLTRTWRQASGKMYDTLASAYTPDPVSIRFIRNDSLPDEGYRMQINPEQIVIEAATRTGWYWGTQTLRQLFYTQLDTVVSGYALPTGIITDEPTYVHRGMMLDIARHFFPADSIKTLIDPLTLYKINVLHLHLTDDQGWRIEIKSWPRLTDIGGSTEVGGGEGGYLTQEAFTELVRYAQEREIMIIPEVDMPGHTNAALASYAELNDNKQATELYTGMRVGFSTLRVRDSTTYQFLNDVIGELAALYPGPYFHIGGDESEATDPDDYLYFVERVKQIVNRNGKQLIGWDEVARATLDTTDVIQYWRHDDKAIRAAEQGASLIYSPASHAYLDMKYNDSTRIGLTWAAPISVQLGYSWSPGDALKKAINKNYQLKLAALPDTLRSAIRGVEAPLWTETVTTTNEQEYLTFPRLPGYAEIGWTPGSQRNWEDYRTRLGRHARMLGTLEVNYYASPQVPWNLPLERFFIPPDTIKGR